MGTSATFNTSNSHVKYNIKIYQNWQSVEGNYSNVTVRVDFWRDNSYTTYGSGTVWCKINGTTYSAGVSPSQKITSSGITLYSQTLNIGHEADGSKNLSVSAWISLNTPLSSGEQGFNEWLSTIPRASQPTLNASSVTMGNNITIYTNRAAGSFGHSLYYQINGGGWNTIATNVATEYTWNVPKDFANKTPNSTNLSVEIICETYNGGTYIGAKNVYFTANVPSDILPTINSVVLTENTTGISEKFGGYVQGKSTIKGAVSANGAYSSTIKNYEIKLNGQSFNSANFTTNPLTGSGICTVKVTDTRNRTASKNISYSVINYINPTINTFTVVRCDENGSENDEGAYAKCTLKAAISPVNNKNDKTFKILYKKLTDSAYTTINLSNTSYSYDDIQIIDADINSEYEFIFKIADYFSSAEKSLNIGTAFTLVDFNKNGKSLAFGRVSTAGENQKKMQVKMDVDLEGNFKINNRTIFDLIYPIGAIYFSINSTNPSSFFGGTWVSWGNGRVPVCVDTNDGDFNYPEKTGGHKKLQSHTHGVQIDWSWNTSHTHGSRGSIFAEGIWDGRGGSYDSYGAVRYTGDGNSESLQPYITCYMWKRTG